MCGANLHIITFSTHYLLDPNQIIVRSLPLDFMRGSQECWKVLRATLIEYILRCPKVQIQSGFEFVVFVGAEVGCLGNFHQKKEKDVLQIE